MKKEIKIAIVAVVALVALYFGLNFLKGISVFSSNSEYYLTFKNVDGVAKNCPIYAEGIAVGQVGDIAYDYSHKTPTRILALVKKKMVIPEGTTAEIHTDLMGNTQVSLVLGDYSNAAIPEGGIIEGNDGDGTMAKLKEMIPVVEGMLPKLDSIVTGLNNLLSDPAVAAMLHSAAGMTANLDAASAQIASLSAEMNSALPGLTARADSLLAHGDEVARNLAAADISATMAQVNRTLDQVQTTVDRINSPRGTIGKLLNDDALYENLSATAADADSLLSDLRARPSRYVHFSLFGKKDK